MADGPAGSARATARSLLGRSYHLSKYVALARMARRRESPTIVFSMGKTGSTAVTRAVQEATGNPVFQVFRLDAARLGPAEKRYRARVAAGTNGAGGSEGSGVAFPGAYHLWESEHLIRHPPSPASPWTVITTVREPVAQAVSAFFHAVRRSGSEHRDSETVAALVEQFAAEDWIQAPLRWFPREFSVAVGFDALAHPFDPNVGSGVIETAAVRLLILRQESFDVAPSALASFLGVSAPVAIARRNAGARGEFADVYRQFLEDARLPPSFIDRAYDSDYARHFYGPAEIDAFRRRWTHE